MPLDNNQEILIDNILKGHFELVKEYPKNPDSRIIGAIYLPENELELKLYNDLRELIIYFLENYSFNFELYLKFFKQLDSIYSKTYNGFEACLSIFVEKIIFPTYFYQEDPNHFGSKWLKKSNLILQPEDREILKIFMFGVRCMAYTQSPNYKFQDYLDYINEIDANLYQEIVSNSNSELEIEVITTENSYFKATSNNLLASIEILAFRHNEETYKEVLNYINQLFAQGFPQSHKLKFDVGEIYGQRTFDIKCLPDYGANRLFNSAAQYHSLHTDIEIYLDLVEKGYGFYTDLHEVNYVEVDGFALFSLILEDAKYIDRFIKFLHKTDSHCLLQNYIPSAFLDRQGITNQTTKTYLRLCGALLEHENFGPLHNEFYKYFNSVAAMKILVEEVEIYKKEQHNIEWFEIYLNFVGGDAMEGFNREIYVVYLFNSREIWKLFLNIVEEFR